MNTTRYNYVTGIDSYKIWDEDQIVSTFQIWKNGEVFNHNRIDSQITRAYKLRALLDSNKITLKEYLRWIKSY